MKTLSLKEFVREVKALPGEIETATVRGLREAANRGVAHVVTEIEAAKAVNTGQLRSSVRAFNVPLGAVLEVAAPHAPFIEYGTRPHWPPEEPIKEWVIRKGLAADEDEVDEITFAIRRHIATFGMEPRHFFKKAMVHVSKDAEKFIKAELERI